MMCYLQINITGYWDLYNRILSDKTTLMKAGAMPSSGLLGYCSLITGLMSMTANTSMMAQI